MKIWIMSILLTFASSMIASDHYFPLEINNQWLYESKFLMTVNQFIESIISEQEINSEMYYVFDWYRVHSDVPFRVEGDKVYTCSDSTKYLMYDFSAGVGTSWTAPDPPSQVMGRMTLKSNSDSVTTPIQVFYPCYHFRHDIDGSTWFDEWFAPGAGIVRRITHLLSGQFDAKLINYYVLTSVEKNSATGLDHFKLYPNYPNPFNGSTTFQFNLSKDSRVKIQIFDTLGRLVSCCYDGYCREGLHRASWQADKEPSGIYILHLSSEEGFQTEKILLQK